MSFGLEDIRRWATALPEVEEATHFRLPSFKVRGKPFAGVEKGGATAIVSVDQAEAEAVVAAEPEGFEEVWRNANGRIFVGLRVDLSRVAAGHMEELVGKAWRHKAPKRLVAAYDAEG